MEQLGAFWISVDRHWVRCRTGLDVDFAYSTRSNCKRAIHDVKRNLVTRLCTQIRTEHDLAQNWQKKYQNLLKRVDHVLESERIYTNTDRSNGEARSHTERDEAGAGGPNICDACTNKSYK
jgi:hypothetical protein